MTGSSVRPATPADLDAITGVARAAGQEGEWTGSDHAYLRHLLAQGKLVVAERAGVVAGFGATRRIGDGPAAVTMLCDLFVDPAAHGQGIGQAMLAVLWRPGTPRMTFSSLHAHALPLYTRAGLDAWWPLLYLAGEVRQVPAPAGWRVSAASAAEVAGLELAWTGVDRSADHRAWAARPAGRPVIARHDGEPMAAGAVAGAGDDYGLVHLVTALAAGQAGQAGAAEAVLAVLASLTPPDGRARVSLPAPHPATRPLLAAGWRVTDKDLFMATDPALLDPRRAVPSPALA